MPRGNDAENALHELADKYGKGVGNAEDLIEATQAATPVEHRKAEMLPLDESATARIRHKLSELDHPAGMTVVDAAVRGRSTGSQSVTLVMEDAEGRYHQGVLDSEGRFITPRRPVLRSESKE